MYKSLMVSIVLVFMLSSVSLSMIGQGEGFQISAENLISLVGIPGTTNSGNSVIVGQNQATAALGMDLTMILQGETGLLNQGASALSLSSILESDQNIGLAGQQIQNANTESSAQNQNNASNLLQNINKNQGTGGIIAGQGIVIGQIQISANRNGTTGNADFSGISQFNGLIGNQNFDEMLNKITTIEISQ